MALSPELQTLANCPLTIVETLGAVHEGIQLRMNKTADPGTRRAFALACTHLEEARSRYTEARARQLGCYSPADLDAPRGGTPASERKAFLDQSHNQQSAVPNRHPGVVTNGSDPEVPGRVVEYQPPSNISPRLDCSNDGQSNCLGTLRWMQDRDTYQCDVCRRVVNGRDLVRA